MPNSPHLLDVCLFAWMPSYPSFPVEIPTPDRNRSLARDLDCRHTNAWSTTCKATPMSRRNVWIVAFLAGFLLTATGLSAVAQTTQSSASKELQPAFGSIADSIVEASRRFNIPAGWIRAVMQAESGGVVNAVSPSGAMGLMQLMPETWQGLRAQYGLGTDPFDPRDNVLAGTAYLRELYDRYGMPGFLAAYHAGPGRYDEHLATSRPLPSETVAYLATVVPALDGDVSGYPPTVLAGPDWRTAPLFVARGQVTTRRGSASGELQRGGSSSPNRANTVSELAVRSGGLFVPNPDRRAPP